MRFDNITLNGIFAQKQGASIASAATTDLANATGNFVLILGNTSISSFGTVDAGTAFILQFAAELTLVYNSTSMVLPTGADVTVAAGDIFVMKSNGGGNWQAIGYQLASGAALVSGVSPDTALLIDITHDSLIGLFPGSEINPKACYRITDAAQGVVRVYGATTSTITGVAFLEGSDDNITTTNGSWGNYDITTDKFSPLTSYVTLDLATWTALVAANGLVAGWRYRVTGAYTFDAFGAKDIVVTADSVNTIETTTQVVFGDFYVPYTTDFAFNQGFFLYAYPSMALTGTQSLAYSTYNWIFNSGLTMYLTDGSLFFQTEVQGSDFSTIIFDNAKALDTNSGAWLTGDFGTYDPNTDTFTPNASVWAPTPTSDGSVVTSPGTLSAGKISKTGNVLSYSFLLTGVTMDFTTANTGFVEIPDSDFPFIPTGDHVVSGQLSEPEVMGITAVSSSNLRINFVNKSGSLTLTTDVSITGQCLL